MVVNKLYKKCLKFVIDSLFQPLLGWPAIKELKVLSAASNVKEMFPLIFTYLGNLKEPYVKLKQVAKLFYVAASRHMGVGKGGQGDGSLWIFTKSLLKPPKLQKLFHF